MVKRIVFRNMDHSQVMEDYAHEKLAKIVDFLEKENRFPIKIDLILEPSKVHEHHKVELLVKSPTYDLVSSYEHEGTEFYKTMDHVIDTMYRNLHNAKDKELDKRKTVGRHEEFKKQR